MKNYLLMFLRTVFGLACRIAPKAAGRAAFRLFCTTFETGKRSPQRISILESAQKQFAHAKRHNISYSGGTIAVFEFPGSVLGAHRPTEQVSGEQNKTVWLVHGWQSSSFFMNKFIDPLLARGSELSASIYPSRKFFR